MSVFEQFVGKYPVSRTLRFELRPQAETVKFLDTTQDFLRAEQYPQLKAVLDEYYRYYIDSVLSSSECSLAFDTQALFAAYCDYKQDKKSKTAQNAYESLKKKVGKAISRRLLDSLSEYNLEDYNTLLKPRSRFRTWVEERKERHEIDELAYDAIHRTIAAFDGFLTCLSGFQTNRKNMFTEVEKTSIAYRITENMERYFDNCINCRSLCKKYAEIQSLFVGKEQFFDPDRYFSYITQDAIKAYNTAIGRDAADETDKGINQLLNEFTQKNGLRYKDVPQMRILYKQILFDKKPFLTNPIDNDRDLLQTVTEAYREMKTYADNLVTIVKAGLDDPTGIFLMTNTLSGLSQECFSGEEDAWKILPNALELYQSVHRVKKDAYKTCVPMSILQEAVDQYCRESGTEPKSLRAYFQGFSTDAIDDAIRAYDTIRDLPALDEDRRAPASGESAGRGYEQVQIVKTLLETFLDAWRFYKPLYLFKDGKKLQPDDRNEAFDASFSYQYEQFSEIVPLYNKVRNYVTTVKKIDKSKVRNYLGKSNLLTGWAIDQENSGCYFYFSEGKYYLLEILDKNGIDQQKLDAGDGKSWRVYYYQQKLDAKNFPRIFLCSQKFQERADRYEKIAEVRRVYENKTYLKSAPVSESEFKHDLRIMIDYYKYALGEHESTKNLPFVFKPSDEYRDILEFYNDAMKSGYSIEKIPTNFEYVRELEKENKILLFMVYCKDFSEYSHGTPNLHTLYLKALFSDENIRRIQEGKPYLKLNGGAQIYTRNASIEKKVTHPKNKPIDNKNPLNQKRESIFTYDLYKDARFSERKMFLHFPVTLNSGTQEPKGGGFNRSVNRFLRDNPDINVIGIDRGERHLLYYSVIDRNGTILEQNTLNMIGTGEVVTDYHTLLDKKEEARDVARRTWGKIESIADVKSGYLSNVIPRLADLMLRYNAVPVLENLNKGMKQSRAKVEKQVYQKFEHALIDKLNYLVFKKRGYEEVGGVLQGYQLTEKLSTFDEIGKQTGFLFYVDPSYTSKICPRTGFVNRLKPDYINAERSREFFGKFESIVYNEAENYFEFRFDYDRFGDDASITRKQWTVCTYGDRWYYSVKKKESIRCDVTRELQRVFDRYGIDYHHGDLREAIVARTEKEFFVALLFILKLTLQIRNTEKGSGDENDYILSCVQDRNGEFFDSRKATETEPKNADANGAYHIALKGLWVLTHIREDGTYEDCTLKDWFAFRQ